MFKNVLTMNVCEMYRGIDVLAYNISNDTVNSDMFSHHLVMREHKHQVNTRNKCNLHINKSKRTPIFKNFCKSVKEHLLKCSG